MTIRRLAMSAVAAASFGLAVGLLAGKPRQLSLVVWLAVGSVWLTWSLVSQLLSIAPLRPDRFEGFRQRVPSETVPKPRGLTSLEGLLSSAGHSPRAATIRLRPRLVAIVEGLLRSRHGIDVTDDPTRAVEVLGDVAWIVDTEQVMERSPSAEEVGTLLARAMAEENR